MLSEASNAVEEQRQVAERGREVAEHTREVQAEHSQMAEEQRQLMDAIRKDMENIRVVAEQMRESAEVVRQLTEGKAREHEVRLQQIEQMLHLTINEFQEALVKQWQVTNNAATSARTILQTAEQLLQAAQKKAR